MKMYGILYYTAKLHISWVQHADNIKLEEDSTNWNALTQ